MSNYTRRAFTALSLSSVVALSACATPDVLRLDPNVIDARVDYSLNQLYQDYPNTRALAEKSSGILIIPLITEAGFGVGGSYGRGALRIQDKTVDYYSSVSATVGFQIGAQQYAHVLFFMTDDALAGFRNSQGWAAGGDIEYSIPDRGETLRAETTTAMAPIFAVIFGQSGLKIGATLEGTKYTRIIP